MRTRDILLMIDADNGSNGVEGANDDITIPRGAVKQNLDLPQAAIRS